MSSSLLSKNLKIKIHGTVILPVVLYGCETWSLTLREERRLKVFENRVLRGIFGLNRDEVTEEWRKLHNEELNDLYCSPNIVRVIKSHMGRGGAYTGFWWGNLRERDHLGDPSVDGRIILRWIFRKWDVRLGKRSSSPVTGLEWPRGFQEVKVPRLHSNGAGWW